MSRPKPLVLIILDGWGYRAETKANAIALARKPTYDRLLREYPNTLIHTSGPFVGLPEGQMGNSEVGHLNIGAGRIVHMDITRIDLMVRNGEFFQHPVLLDAMKHARSGERRLHLFGLVSDGGVHSQQAHLYALLKMAKQNGLERVFVHAFMDGRDTLPTNGAGYLEQLQQKMREYNCGKIATVNGRYYAMDRDRRWERIAKAYSAMVSADAQGGKNADPVQGMKDSYNKGVTDEFVIPFVCTDSRGQALATIRDEDSCLCFNFRADRVRQITRALARNSGLNQNGGSDLPGAADLDSTIPGPSPHLSPVGNGKQAVRRWWHSFRLLGNSPTRLFFSIFPGLVRQVRTTWAAPGWVALRAGMAAVGSRQPEEGLLELSSAEH